MDDKIKYVDLLYSVYISLKNNFTEAKINIKESRTEVKGPLFFVQVKPLDNDSYRYYTKDFVNIIITFTDIILDQEKILNVKDELKELFDYGLRINDTFIYFDKKGFNESEDCIILTLTIKYHNSKDIKNIPIPDRYTEFMHELNFILNEDKEEID
ncbi:phage tail terminator family protein [Clostridium diolis]|uniref:phage tail terminator family protein n=1 Tax=Clostridium diolis TaxID=223919 RepID=UPI003AF60E3E